MKGSPRFRVSGFTLVEISIVLIVIGLILGGVLAGRDLIRAAMVRKQIAQFEEYGVAVNTFRMKYNALPGDISPSEATGFGFVTRGGGDGHGDNDGQIEGCGAYWSTGCETILFWRDLSEAKLIKDSLTTATDTDPVVVNNGVDAALYYPRAIWASDKNILIGNDNAAISWFVLADSLAFDPGTPFYFIQNAIPPYAAYNMDTKMDDGKPTTGTFRNTGTINGPTYDYMVDSSSSGSMFCVSGGAYNLNSSFYDSMEYCIPRVKMR